MERKKDIETYEESLNKHFIQNAYSTSIELKADQKKLKQHTQHERSK